MLIAAAEVLTGERLILTPLSVNDAQAMQPVLAEPGLYRFTGGAAPSLEELERRFTLSPGREPPRCASGWRPNASATWSRTFTPIITRRRSRARPRP